MSAAWSDNSAGAGSYGDGAAIVRSAVDWLGLAATPIFAMMALMTTLGGDAEPVCSAMQQESLWSGMVPMYLLMGAFHSAPWLRLISGGRS